MGTKRSAVVFASYINNDDALRLGLRFLDVFQSKFVDCDIFIGINPCQKQQEWINAIERSPLNIKFALTTPDLVMDSDASAYQTALRLLKESKYEHEQVWFGHTKGATSGNYDITDRYINNLFLKREVVDELFGNPEFGIYGLECALHPEKIEDRISQYRTYNSDPLMIMFLYSFYVIRGNIVYDFVHNCLEEFFTHKLKGDRYFFERDFYQIVFMQGYLPMVENVVQLNFNNWDRIVSDRRAFNNRIKGWRKSTGNKDWIHKVWECAVRYKIQQKRDEFVTMLDFLRNENVKNIVDIGCYDGGTSICFAQLGDKVISCDMKLRFNCKEMEHLCDYDFIEGNSHSWKTYMKIKKALNGQQVDFLFIDGDHGYKGSFKDYKMYKNLVRPGGYIAFHDILDTPTHRKLSCYVNKTWEAVKKYHKYWKEIAAEHDIWGGIGIVQTSGYRGGSRIREWIRKLIE